MSKPTHGKGDRNRSISKAWQDSSYWTRKESYGYCPTCNTKGVSRERRPDGYDTCEQGHKYASNEALTTPKP